MEERSPAPLEHMISIIKISAGNIMNMISKNKKLEEGTKLRNHSILNA